MGPPGAKTAGATGRERGLRSPNSSRTDPIRRTPEVQAAAHRPPAPPPRAWTPPTGTLGALCAAARARADELALSAAALEDAARAAAPGPPFATALRGAPGAPVAVIAELKRSSPSKGAINPGLGAARQALAYVDGGAAAVSVLTEPTRFAGSNADVQDAVAALAGRAPVLRKDFLVDPVQLVEARALGASAALLIARALAPGALRDMAVFARGVGLEVLIEVRDRWELDAALAADAAVIGVNNRDLETLRIDLATGDALVPLIPGDRVAVFESGIVGVGDVARAARAGADAVLVGSAVSAASEPTAAVAGLTGVPRAGRPAAAPTAA